MPRATHLTAAALTLGFFACTPATFAAEPEAAAPNVNRPVQTDRPDNSAQIAGVRDLLARSTDAAVQENGANQLMNQFTSVSQDRTGAADAAKAAENIGGTNASPPRLGEPAAVSAREAAANNKSEAGSAAGDAAAGQSKKLNDTVAQFQRDWKDKFNQDFRVQNPEMVYADIKASDLRGSQVQAAGADLHATNGNIPNTSIRPADNAKPGADAANNAGRGSGSPDVSSQPEIVTLNLPETNGAKSVQVDLVREGNTYKFARPKSFDRQELTDKLTRNLDEVDQMKAQWPSDVNAAYRVVTQHVMMAVHDAQQGSAAPAGAHLEGDRSGNATPAPR